MKSVRRPDAFALLALAAVMGGVRGAPDGARIGRIAARTPNRSASSGLTHRSSTISS